MTESVPTFPTANLQKTTSRWHASTNVYYQNIITSYCDTSSSCSLSVDSYVGLHMPRVCVRKHLYRPPSFWISGHAVFMDGFRESWPGRGVIKLGHTWEQLVSTIWTRIYTWEEKQAWKAVATLLSVHTGSSILCNIVRCLDASHSLIQLTRMKVVFVNLSSRERTVGHFLHCWRDVL